MNGGPVMRVHAYAHCSVMQCNFCMSVNLHVYIILCLSHMSATAYQVGVLDIDLCGPSIPHLFNLEGSEVHQCSDG